MSLRLLHLLDHSIPIQSGYTFRTRAIIREQRRVGWETFHLTSPKHTAPSNPEEDVDGLRFYRTLWNPRPASRVPVLFELALMRATARRLTEIIDDVRPDILHVHSPVLNALPAIWVGRRLGIPVIYEVRAFWEDAAVDHGTGREGGLRYRITHALESFALRRAGHVTTICEGLRSDIVARGISASRVTVIPNAVDLDAFEYGIEQDLELKVELGLANCTIVGFIGSFYRYEGLDLLLNALPSVVDRVPNVRVLLVGGGAQEKALMLLAEAIGIREKVIFTGRIPHHQVQRYYSIVDVFAYPRRSMRLTELVTPLKPLEAMAQGRLVVASDVGGHKELIRDGETGILFRAGDAAALGNALVQLLGDPGRWYSLRQQGRNFVEHERNWKTVVAKYGPIYESLINSTA